MKRISASLWLILAASLVTGCVSQFAFDAGDNQEWRTAGLYQDNTMTPIAGSFSDDPAGWADGRNSPNAPPANDPGDEAGAIMLGTTGSSLPAGPMGLWSWHLNSPDLGSRSNWQQLSGIRADVVGDMATGPTSVQISAKLVVIMELPDGTMSEFTDGVMHNVPINLTAANASWQTLTLDFAPLSIPSGSTLRYISVRIFGPAAHYDGFVLLDRVFRNPL